MFSENIYFFLYLYNPGEGYNNKTIYVRQARWKACYNEVHNDLSYFSGKWNKNDWSGYAILFFLPRKFP